MSEGQLLLRVLCLDVNLADRALEQADLGAVMAGLDDNSFFSDADDLADDAADGGPRLAQPLPSWFWDWAAQTALESRCAHSLARLPLLW